MKYYELSYLLSVKLTQDEIKQIQERILLALRELKGILDEENPPMKRTLAYPIRKEKEALLVSLTFFLNPENAQEFKERLRKEKGVLRFLMFKKKMPKERAVEVKPVKKPPKVELEKIEEKLEEILGEKI